MLPADCVKEEGANVCYVCSDDGLRPPGCLKKYKTQKVRRILNLMLLFPKGLAPRIDNRKVKYVIYVYTYMMFTLEMSYLSVQIHVV